MSAPVADVAALARRVLAGPARLGGVRLVVIDGPSGAGKTVLAGHLVGALRAAGAAVELVSTDDLLDGWLDTVTFWPRLEDGVLAPLRAGRPGGYHPYDWYAHGFAARRVPVPVPDVLVVEGVTAARRVGRDEATLSVFVTAPADVCLARGLARGGEYLRADLLSWRERESEFFAADGTRDAVDLVVDSSGLGSGQRLRSEDMTNEAQLRAAVAAQMPGVRADLEALVRIPGIAFDGFDFTPLARSAEAVADLLRGAGLPEVSIERAGDGHPAVIGRRPAPPGAPTVLLYAHHDVQPIGDRAEWRTDPFEPVERDGRLYGRGAADDKAGIMAHIAALRAFGDDLPVGVVVFVEGEEEFGSASLEDLLRAHRDKLTADVIVIADSGNWAVGQPALTTSLRGIVNAFINLRTLDHAVHSGMFGGAVPDALTTLVRLLATLHDDNGDVAVDGLVSGHAAPLDYPEDRFREEAGMLDGVQLIGTGRIVERLWTKPAISVLGLDAPATNEAPNALVPSARAKVSIRLAPGDDPDRAYANLWAHLEKHTPFGAQVSLELEHDGAPSVIDATGPAFDAARAAFTTAWDGTAPVDIGVGGSIPFIATFQEMFPQAAILVTGVEDPDSRAHGANESLHLGEFARVCLAEALLLANVAEKVRPAA